MNEQAIKIFIASFTGISPDNEKLWNGPSPMFTFLVHKFRDSQSEGGDLERNTCAKHICLRAVVADDLGDILWFFWSLCPWKEASWLLKTSLFKQLSRNSTDRVSLKLLSHIDGSIFYFYSKRSASTTLYNKQAAIFNS